MSDSTDRERADRGWSLVGAGLLAVAGVVAVGLVIRGPAKPASSVVSSGVDASPSRQSSRATPRPPKAYAPLGPQATKATEPLTPENLRRRIKLGIDYLVRACGPDGRFVYRVHLDPSVTPRPMYNVLRHAGTLYSLGMYYESCPDEEVRDVLIRAGAFLKRECLAPIPDRDDLAAIWSPPELVMRDKPPQAKLGGTGLGLVGLLAVEKAQPGATPLEDFRKLGRFLLYLQKDDGSFYTKYIPSEGGRWDQWTSLYYPGEAALGLVMLHQRDPSPEWLVSAIKALSYLARIRKGADDVPADHWALIATARLWPLLDASPTPGAREALLRHAKQVCEQMLRNQQPRPDDSPLAGCFTNDGRTSPTATQLEGLMAALEFLPAEEEPLRARIVAAVEPGLEFLMRAQVTSGKYAGGVPRGIVLAAETSPLRDLDKFNARAGEIRIDYVQHAAGAMMQYQRLFFGGNRSKSGK